MIAGQIEIQLLAGIARLQADMDRANRIVSDSTSRMSRAAGLAKGALGAIAGLLSLNAFAGWIKGAIDAADAASKLSAKTGVAVQDIAGLQLAFDLGGAGGNLFSTSMVKLSKAVTEGNKGLAALKISTTDSTGQLRMNKEVLYSVADAFQKMDNDARRASMAVEIFGKTGADLIPLLIGGSEGLRQMDEMARKLGLTISEQTAKDAEAFNDNLDLLAMGSQGVARGIAAELLPTLTALSSSFLTSMTSGEKLKNTADFLGTGLKILYTIALGIAEVFSTVGRVIAGLATIMTTQLTGAINVLSKMARGDFKEAWNSAKATVTSMGTAAVVVAGDIKDSWKDTGKAASDVWTGAGNAAFMAMATQRKASEDLLAQQKKIEAATDAARKKAVQVAETAEKARASFIEGLKKEIASMGLSAAQIKLNEAATLGFTGAKLKNVEALVASREAFQAEEKFAKQAALATTQLMDGLNASTVQLVAEARALEESNDRMGASKTVRADLDAQRLLNLATLKDENAILAETLDLSGAMSDEYRKQAKALRERAAATVSGAQKELNQEWLKEFEAAVKKYDDIFSNGFADMLNNGKAGWKSFTKSLTTTFKTSVADQIYKMFAQPFVMKLVASLIGVTGGGASGMASAAGIPGIPSGTDLSSLSGVMSAAKSAYSAISSGFSGISTAVADTVQGIMYQSGMTGQIASNGAFASGAGTVAGVAAGAAVGVYGGRAISNGYAVGGGSGNSAVNTGTAAGAIIGSIIPGLGTALGAAIGGLLGGAVNRLFGHKAKEFGDTTLNGSFGAGGFAGTSDQAWSQKGGLFRSDKSGVDQAAIDAVTAKAFTDGYDALKGASMDFAKALGVNADAVKNRAQSLSIALTKDAAANEQAIADFFINVGNQIALELVPGLQAFAKAGESASATLERVATNYAFVDVALEAIGREFGAVGINSIAARDGLVDLTGGIEAVGRGSAFFAQTFLTEAERMAPVAESVRATMAALGLSTVDTRDEFKNVVLGLDLTTQKGAETFAGLMKVQEAFANVYPALVDTAGAAKSAAEALSERSGLQDQLDQLTMSSAQLLTKQRLALDVSNRGLFDQIQMATRAHEAQSAAKTSLGDLIGNMRNFGNSARSMRDSLMLGSLSNLTPEQQYAEARRQLDRTETAALAGDVAAQSNFAAVQTAFLAISQKVNGGDSLYDADFKKAIQTADAISAWTNGQIDVAQASLTALNDQVAWLAKLNESVRAVEQATVAPRPQFEVGAPGFRAGSDSESSAMLAEIKALRETVDGLRGEQKTQTGDMIGAAAAIAARSDTVIVQGVGAAVKARVSADNSTAALV